MEKLRPALTGAQKVRVHDKEAKTLNKLKMCRSHSVDASWKNGKTNDWLMATEERSARKIMGAKRSLNQNKSLFLC